MSKLFKTSYWSYSIYKRCPYSYYLTFTKGLRGRRNVKVMLPGIVLHHMMEDFYREKRLLLSWWEDHFHVYWSHHVVDEKIEWENDDEERRIELNTWGLIRPLWGQLVKHRLVSKNRVTEFHLNAEIPTPGLRLTGRVDLMLENSDESYRIVDLKCGKYSSADWEQLLFYVLALEHMGFKISTAGFLVPGEKRYVTQRFSEAKIRDMLFKVIKMKDGVRDGEFHARTVYNLCKWCNVLDFCPYYKAKFGGLGFVEGLMKF